LVIGLSSCVTLDLIGHAQIHGDLLYPSVSQNPIFGGESAEVVEVDGHAVPKAPLPALADSGPHPAAWASAGKHLIKIKVTPFGQRMGTVSPIVYVTFSANFEAGTSYLLYAVNDTPMLFKKQSGPAVNSLPPFNEPIPVKVVAEDKP
jgi:hypothetical protein